MLQLLTLLVSSPTPSIRQHRLKLFVRTPPEEARPVFVLAPDPATAEHCTKIENTLHVVVVLCRKTTFFHYPAISTTIDCGAKGNLGAVR